MKFPDGITDIAPGKIATVVTSLEMLEAPALSGSPSQMDCQLKPVKLPDIDWYLGLYRRVGEDWLWFSRLILDKKNVQEIIQNPEVKIFTLQVGGQDRGLLELDFRQEKQCELAFLGVTQELIGRGLGQYMLDQAITIAWGRNISRLWVHTCTLDHPNTVSFYMQSGFKPYLRQIEVLDDPRLTGEIATASATHIPIL